MGSRVRMRDASGMEPDAGRGAVRVRKSVRFMLCCERNAGKQKHYLVPFAAG